MTALLALAAPVLVLLILGSFHILTAPKVGRFGLRFLFVLVTAEAVAFLAFSIVVTLVFRG